MELHISAELVAVIVTRHVQLHVELLIPFDYDSSSSLVGARVMWRYNGWHQNCSASHFKPPSPNLVDHPIY